MEALAEQTKEKQVLDRVNDAFTTLNINAEAISLVEGLTFTKIAVRIPPHMKPNELIRKQEQLAMQFKFGSVPVIRPDYNDGLMVIEVPNEEREFIDASDVFKSKEWRQKASKCVIPLLMGYDVENKLHVADLNKLPHLMVAGTTGSGKSVALKAMMEGVMSFYSQYSSFYRFIIIDPKAIEFGQYASSPFTKLFSDNVEEGIKILKDAVKTMNYRLKELFPKAARKYGKSCNSFMQYAKMTQEDDEFPFEGNIIIVIDELSDLILTDKELEKPLCLLAQKGRAAGIHLIVATQRPSVDVLTGLIKANLPAKLCLKVATRVDARVIFGSESFGAEQLMGRGDMLFLSPEKPVPVRLQCPYVE